QPQHLPPRPPQTRQHKHPPPILELTPALGENQTLRHELAMAMAVQASSDATGIPSHTSKRGKAAAMRTMKAEQPKNKNQRP
ncbi:hypothetical protein ACT3TS_01055, partial [Specibacter sp. AOP5-B1-6]|uniref:hypothetical protein n=1 Tax=Specibacter sp. AOP5-B1-6 TaxID=3457653 RepID=UPI00402BDDF7